MAPYFFSLASGDDRMDLKAGLSCWEKKKTEKGTKGIHWHLESL